MEESTTTSSDDLNSARTHYEILGVDEKADFDTIKRAHRKLALRYHPDKQRRAANENEGGGGEDDTTDTTSSKLFSKIQTAWECLSDQSKRVEYDESLNLLRERSAEDIIKAQVVKLSEMQCEVCDIADDEEDTENAGDCIEPKTQNLYSYMCRCGDYFEILEEELKSKSDESQGNIFVCQSCSLSINIMV